MQINEIINILLDIFYLYFPIKSKNLGHFDRVEDIGFEPMTPCVQGRCSSQLS